jgi:hypothetical protein
MAEVGKSNKGNERIGEKICSRSKKKARKSECKSSKLYSGVESGKVRFLRLERSGKASAICGFNHTTD